MCPADAQGADPLGVIPEGHPAGPHHSWLIVPNRHQGLAAPLGVGKGEAAVPEHSGVQTRPPEPWAS